MHLIYFRAALSLATNIRLICDDDEEKASVFQPRTSCGDVIVKLKINDGGGRVGPALKHPWTIEHSVAIEENRALLYLVLSHFVCATLSFG